MAPNDPARKPNAREGSGLDDEAVLRAVQDAALAAKVGENLQRILPEIVEGFVPAVLQAFAPTVAESSGASSLPSAGPLPSLDKLRVPPDVQGHAAWLLKILSQQQRGDLLARMSNDAQPLVSLFASWLRCGPQNLLVQTGPLFETPPDVMPALERMQHQAMNAVLGSDFMERMGTIHAYLHHKLAPSARERHATAGNAGSTIVKEYELFLDLQRDPGFPDFINEMPRLLTDASLSLYHAFASALPSGTRKDRHLPSDQADVQEIKQFLHVLCCLADLVGAFILSSKNRPTLELELCCATRVLQSAANALYLEFLHRTYPVLLVPPSADDDRALDAAERGFICLLKVLKKAHDRLEDRRLLSGVPSLEYFRLLSSEAVYKDSELTTWLSEIVEAGSGFDLTESVPRGYGAVKRSLDCQPWIQTTSINCGGQRGRVDSIETTSTRSAPSVGHGIGTVYALYTSEDRGKSFQSMSLSCRCHAPNSEAFPNNFTFISPSQVLGKAHPLSRVAERVALLGDVAHCTAVDLQRRIDWLETAQEKGLPLRTILYTNETSDFLVCFNLFSQTEADRLELKGPLVPMTGKHREVYEILQTIKYDLPKDSDGRPLPPEQLLMEILDADRGDRGDDEEESPPAPVEDGKRSRRRSRGPVGAGWR